ncbi:MAG: metal-dependent hydrolase [Methanobacteriaceae archaeon]
MKIKWLGHSAFEIVTENDLNILVDPFISNNPVCQMPVEEFNPNLICITHGHADHFGDAMEIANLNNVNVLSNHEISLFLSKQGIETMGMNIGGTIKFQDIKITMLNAEHSSDIDFVEETTPGGSAVSFLFTLENGLKIFHAGDTGLFGDMKTVIGDIYKPDIAILPIGAKYTMGPEEAAIAAKWISPKKVIPMHYNTFPVIEQDLDNFKELLNEQDSSMGLIDLDVGEEIELY